MKKYNLFQRDVIILLLLGIITATLWQFQFGRYILYPFTILGTWFHEIGHGLTSIILGGSFKYLELFPDGSGVAVHSGDLYFGNFGSASVAAGGPLFPMITGSLMIITSLKIKSSNIILLVFGLFMLASVVFWIRTIFGITAISLIAAVFTIISIRANSNACSFVLKLIGIEACISFYLNIGYYFSSGGVIEGTSYHSDTQVIANNLFLPYWFWGGMLVALSIMLIFFLLRLLSRKEHYLNLQGTM